MKKVLVVLILLTAYGVVTSQPDRSRYLLYKPTADSIVAHFLGDSIKERFVELELKKCAYLRMKNNKIIRSGFDKSSFVPDYYHFVYRFRHPAFSGKSLTISFLLNSNRKLSIISSEKILNTEDAYKLESVSNGQTIKDFFLDTLKVNFMARAGELLHVKSKTNLQLVWLPYQSDKRSYINGLGSSSIAWSVKGTQVFRGKKYKGHYLVDLKSGKIINQFAIPWD